MGLKVHLSLGRFFAAPAIISSVVLGGLLTGASFWGIFLASLSGVFIMAAAHSANSLLDYYWTGLDKGEAPERSQPKPYTHGQQLLASGSITWRDNFLNIALWLFLSIIPLLWLPQVALIPWALIVPLSVWYSWAKIHWHPELPLGLGFGPFAVWLGMGASGHIAWWPGFLAGLPLFMIFGVVAENIDQRLDQEANWKKGARSLGMWMARRGWSPGQAITPLVAVTFVIQMTAVRFGVLSPYTLLSALCIPMVWAFNRKANKNLSSSLLWGLGAVFIYEIGLVFGQALSGQR